MTFNSEDGEEEYIPDNWEMCCDRFLATISAMKAEGFSQEDILAGIAFAACDHSQVMLDN